MATPALRPVLQRAQRLAADRGADDADLVRRFAADRDDAAFRALVRRHGPMVLDVCRAVLRNPADADDAFQTTFLALARGSAAIRRGGSVTSWLYGVAYRTALKARAAAARRRRHEARADTTSANPDDLSWAEVRATLHEELNALAERHRGPLVLCYLQGRTQDQAAAALGLSKGTLKRRLEEGRALLRARLVRRGLGAVVAVAAAWPAAAVAVPDPLVDSVVAAAVGMAVAPAVVVPAKAVAILLALAVGAGSAALSVRSAVPVQPGPAAAEKPRTDAFGDELPEGALARLGTVRMRQPSIGTVTTAFSADGKVFASCGEDLRVWDPATGRLVRAIRDGDRTRSYCPLVLAPDGRWVAGGARASTCVWDVATGKLLHEFPASGQSLAGSPDGKLLAAALKDGSVGVWDVATGRELLRLRERAARGVARPTFTADGKELVTASDDRVCHWSVADGTLRKSVEIDAGRASVAPGGRTLAVVSRDGPVVLRDSATGADRATLRPEPGYRVSNFAFSGDGKTFAFDEADPEGYPEVATVAVWDAATGVLARRVRVPAGYVRSLGLSPDGRVLVTTGSGAAVRLWDAATGKPLLSLASHTADVQGVAFAPAGRAVMSVALDGTVRAWDAATGRPARELPGHRWRVDAVAVTADGAVVSGGADGAVRVTRPDGTEVRRFLLDGDPAKRGDPATVVLAVAATPDGKVAAWSRSLATAMPRFHVWDVATGKAVADRRDALASGEVPVLSPDGRLALAKVYENAAAPAPVPVPGGAGGAGGPVRVCVGLVVQDIATGREVLRIREPGSFDGPGPLAFTPDGRGIVAAPSRRESPDKMRYENGLRLWELATGKERLAVACGSADRWFQHVAASPDGRTAATARADGTIQLWDLGTGKEVVRRAGAGEVSCLAFAPDGRSLATGLRDGTTLVWDATPPARRPAADPAAAQLEKWWADLLGDDARKADAAVRALGDSPSAGVAFLRGRVKPVAAAPAEQVAKLIADLDGSEFRRRDAATKELAALGESAAPALRAALRGASAEQQGRVEKLLRALDVAPAGERLRQVRAVEALELAGTADARAVLAALAAGVPDARLTQEAAAAVARLARR